MFVSFVWFTIMLNALSNPIFSGWRIVPMLQTVVFVLSLLLMKSAFDFFVTVSVDVDRILSPEPELLTHCLLSVDIFHWRCFNRYAQDHPPNTTPAGYTCPDCNMTIFPPVSSNSPISIQLKNLLANAEWAKPGLALSGTNGPASGMDPRNVSFTDLIQEDDEANHIQVLKHHDHNNHSVPININPVSSFMDSTQWTSSRSSSAIHESRLPLLMDNDVDEDKYKSKPPSEFITRWLRNRQSFLPRTSASDTSSIMALYGKYIIPLIIFIAIIFTLIHYFLKYGREAANRDLSLDPAFNPNIRVEGD